MIGFKGLAAGLAGAVLSGGVVLADAAPDRGACLRTVTPGAAAATFTAYEGCVRGPRLVQRRAARPMPGYRLTEAYRVVPVRFTSLLILGVGY